MTRIVFFVFGALISLLFSQGLSATECHEVMPSDSEAFLQLPVVFEFGRIDLQHEDMYLSLRPRLDWAYPPEQGPSFHEFDPMNGRMRYDFCLSANSLEDMPDEPRLQIGLNDHFIDFDQQAVEHIANDNSTGIVDEVSILHDPIILINQPAPNWLMAVGAQLTVDMNDQLYLEVTLFNPTDLDLLGPEIALDFFRREGLRSCYPSPPIYVDVVFVVMRDTFNGELVEVYSSASGLNASATMNGSFRLGCDSDRFRAELGNTGVVAAGEYMRMIFRLHVGELTVERALEPILLGTDHTARRIATSQAEAMVGLVLSDMIEHIHGVPSNALRGSYFRPEIEFLRARVYPQDIDLLGSEISSYR